MDIKNDNSKHIQTADAHSIISVSGDPGAGKTSVAKALCAGLSANYFSVGDIHRDMASALGLSVRELNELAELDPSIDKAIDRAFMEGVAVAKKPLIVDARLGWLRLPKALKIRFSCTTRTAGERIFNAARSSERFDTVDLCVTNVQARREIERRRYQHQYGVELSDARNYDILVVTDDVPADDIVHQLTQLIATKADGTLVLAPPKRIFPTTRPCVDRDKVSQLFLVQKGDHFFVSGSHQLLANALRANTPLIASKLASQDIVSSTERTSRSMLEEWQSTYGFLYPQLPGDLS